jgi:hypothetical protein
MLTYYTRTSCPITYGDIDIKAKCEVDNPGTITDIIPVSSRDGKVLYKNKYCSYCHGEKRTYNWDVTVHRASSQTCRESLQSETINIETVSTKILSNCMLEFRPPSNFDFLNVVCFVESTVTKRCNVTGRWDMYDSEVNNLCIHQTG